MAMFGTSAVAVIVGLGALGWALTGDLAGLGPDRTHACGVYLL